MKKYVVVFALVFGFSTLAYGGEPFKCHIASEDKAVDIWINSISMQGHGLQHYASHSFAHQNQSYSFDGQVSIFSEEINVRIYSGGTYAWAKGMLSFGSAGGGTITIRCESVK